MVDVSVIIAVYNDERHIKRAIRSCLWQTIARGEHEVIVVDDGSTDATPRILANFAYLDWLKVITLSENRGIGAASNEGIKAARGKYIVRVDSDDYINENMIFIQRMYLDMNKEMAAVAVDYYRVDEEEDIIDRKSPLELPIACGVMFRKTKLTEVGLYKEVRIDEEKELFFRFLDKYPTYRIALPLYRYYQRKGSLTRE